MRRLSLVILFLCMTGLAAWYLVFPGRIRVSGAQVQPAKVSALTAGDLNQACICDLSTSSNAYLKLENLGLRADRLVGVSSPAADSVRLRRTVWGEGTPYLETLDAVPVAPLGEVRFAAGEYSLQLNGLRGDLNPGDTVQIIFHFEHQGLVEVWAPVRSSAGE